MSAAARLLALSAAVLAAALPPAAAGSSVDSADPSRRLEEENYICEAEEVTTFWDRAVGTEDEPCTSIVQRRTNQVESDGTVLEGNWDGNFTEPRCVAARYQQRYSISVSTDGPCGTERRTSTFDSDVSCESREAGECSSAELGIWSAFNGTFEYDSCTEIGNQVRYQTPAAASVSECIEETQVRRAYESTRLRLLRGLKVFFRLAG